MYRRRVRSLLVAAMCASAALILFVPPRAAHSIGVPPVGAPADPVLSVTLTVTGPLSVPQGRPATFQILIHNSYPFKVTGFVDMDLIPPGSEAPRSFQPWFGAVPADASVSFSRSITTGTWYAAQGRFLMQASGRFFFTDAPTLGAIARPITTAPLQVTAPSVPVPQFQDVTAAMGITTRLHSGNTCQDYAAGAAWGDVDGDGRLDLYIPQRVGPSELWVNTPNGFVERAAAYGVDNKNTDGTYGVGIGAVFVDYDNDGRPDLFVSNDGINRLYHNDGNGRFTDVTQAAGLADDGNHTSAAWGDFNGDGNLDLFVTSHGRRASCSDNFSQLPDHLYKNNGNGTFTDVTSWLPHTGTTMGLSFQGSWLDYDGSGRQSLLLSNDRIGPSDPSNILWRNDGTDAAGMTHFTDVSQASHAGVGINAMGAAIGDFNREGRLDIAQPNIGPISLLHNEGDGTFSSVAASAGVDRVDQGDGQLPIWWGMGFVDFANSGWEDLFVVAGDLFPTSNSFQPQPNAMFINDGSGRFLDLSAASGAADPGVGRGVAFADFDGDGRVDMVVVNQGDKPILYRNVTPLAGHWLELRLVGTASNRDGCGAEVTALIPNAQPMFREVFCGSTGMSSGSDQTIHLGLGASTSVPSIRIRWPSGRVQTVSNLAADQQMVVTEP